MVKDMTQSRDDALKLSIDVLFCTQWRYVALHTRRGRGRGRRRGVRDWPHLLPFNKDTHSHKKLLWNLHVLKVGYSEHIQTCIKVKDNDPKQQKWQVVWAWVILLLSKCKFTPLFIHPPIHPLNLRVVTPTLCPPPLNLSSSPSHTHPVPSFQCPSSPSTLNCGGFGQPSFGKALKGDWAGKAESKKPCLGWRWMATDNGTVPSASFATIQEQSHRSPSEVKWLLDSQWPRHMCGWKLLLGWIYCWREEGGSVIHPFTWK